MLSNRGAVEGRSMAKDFPLQFSEVVSEVGGRRGVFCCVL